MSGQTTSQQGQTCYRHPDRPAPLSCTRCGRPICLDDAIDAPVGFLCPEDAQVPARQRQAARRVSASEAMVVTRVLVGIMVVVYVGEQIPGLDLVRRGALFGPAVAAGQWWRIVTSGFLHDPQLPFGLVHIGFNAYLTWQLGMLLEGTMRPSRYLATFMAGLLAGSAGALVLSYEAFTIGASGAVFGLMGAAMIGLRSRGINPWSTSIGSLLILNLVFTFFVGGISIGGHLGGLIGGAIAGWLVFEGPERARGWGAWAVAGAFGLLAILVGINGWDTGLGL
ncbi:rhomboid family intramembrane serine protease [Salsipaludibacter albus]|uniref:rhomboid family intramembrane serine protease n=1 Tax=Salsipaludibacter albus TaxID=2849650 RepID=UPI001EE3E104|nr:rhomboid family intramembrane serine protease [Salsipaludibacter albus]MBY5161170.1 rhomboid family intramembrane serine protease [Salsipaludibacter albus]